MTVSAAQLKCLEQVRYDVLTYYWSHGWTAVTPHAAIYTDWFTRIKADAALGNAVALRDASYGFATLEDYADALNCTTPSLIEVPPNTSPNAGNYQPGMGTTPPVATAPPASGQFTATVQNLMKQPVVVMAVIALAIAIFYKAPDVTFSR